ncbi:hypothetical protein HDU88_005075 [Geranomyces variabilis]|nr:hypothetical protein HDU88_005075 [Geranomyces variabilis]
MIADGAARTAPEASQIQTSLDFVPAAGSGNVSTRVTLSSGNQTVAVPDKKKYRCLFAVFPSEGTYSGVDKDCEAYLLAAQRLENAQWIDVTQFQGDVTESIEKRADDLCASRPVLATASRVFNNNFQFYLGCPGTVLALLHLGHADSDGALLFPAFGHARIPLCRPREGTSASDRSSIVDRFERNLKTGCDDVHLILIADSCYSGALVADLRKYGQENQEFSDLLKRTGSSISVQSSAAWWQKAGGGVFTPWYLEKTFIPAIEQREIDRVQFPLAVDGGINIPFQYAEFATVGSLPPQYERLLYRALIPVPIHFDDEPFGDRGRKAKGKHAQAEDEFRIVDLKLGRCRDGPELFVHVRANGEPRAYSRHIHVKAIAGKRMEFQVGTGSCTARVDLDQKLVPGKWIWMDPKKGAKPDDLRGIVGETTDIEPLGDTFVFCSETLDGLASKQSVSQEEETSTLRAYSLTHHGSVFAKHPDGEYYFEPNKERHDAVMNSSTPWIKTMWKMAQDFVDNAKKAGPNEAVFLAPADRSSKKMAESIKLSELDFHNPDHWRMVGSLLGTFRNKEPTTYSLTDMRDRIIPCQSSRPPVPLRVAVQGLCKAKRDILKKPSFDNTYAAHLTVLLHWHLRTSLLEPHRKVKERYYEIRAECWDEIHFWAASLLQHWDLVVARRSLSSPDSVPIFFAEDLEEIFSADRDHQKAEEPYSGSPHDSCSEISWLDCVNDKLSMLLAYLPITAELD